jgi:DhnA family fructose-bisphosphate aldolase class Ia
MALNKILIPADVPRESHDTFTTNYQAITRGTGRLMLFACDQKIEHLNTDFNGVGIHPDAQNPEHIFRIAQAGYVGALATHAGLIARYAPTYPTINYVVKLNGKTNLIKPELNDPMSNLLWTVDQVVTLQKQSNLLIRAIGYTIYLGSMYEDVMLTQAAQAVFDAHQAGLIALLWIYLRGAGITNDQDPHFIAGAAGIANSLGADFVKIKPVPETQLSHIIAAAGNTKVICSCGEQKNPEQFLRELDMQLKHGASGNATGRNIFQRSLPEAIAMTKAIAALVYENKDVQEVIKMVK